MMDRQGSNEVMVRNSLSLSIITRADSKKSSTKVQQTISKVKSLHAFLKKMFCLLPAS